MNPRNFFAELKRRNVYKVAIAYAIVAWLLIQIATQVFPFFEIPNWAVRLVVLVIIIGFPIALVIAWAFELTPEGIKRTENVAPGEFIPQWSGRKFAALIVSVAVVAAGLLAFQFLRPKSATTAVPSTTSAPPAAAVLPGIAEKSIAVLPFENLSDDKQNAFFTDGVQDEILADLAKVADLKVISRTSVMLYKSGNPRNLGEIGQQLGVAHVLEGSVQRSANRVRVTAQLIDVRSDAHLWAQTYDRDLADVFAIQSEIAKTIADQLQAKLSPNERAAIEERPTADLAAFDLYVRARTRLRSASFGAAKEDFLQAVELLNQAVARDPKFFIAYCRLASAHDRLYFINADHTPARLASAEAAVQAALRLRPDAGEGHLALAQHLYRAYRDYDRARAEIAIAQRALPNSSEVFELTGYIDRRQGRWDESARNLEKALESDPRDFDILQQIAASYNSLRRYADMATVLDRALALVPKDFGTRVARAKVDLDWRADSRPLHATIDAIVAEDPAAAPSFADNWMTLALCERDAAAAGRALAALAGNDEFGEDAVRFSRAFCEGLLARARGDNDAARSAFNAARAQQENMVRAQPENAPPLCVLGLIDAGLGRKEEALREGRRAVELLPVTRDSLNGAHMIEFFAIICAWTGEKDLALQQLAIATQIPGTLSYGQLRLHPYWDPLRGDPQFEKIVASLAPKGAAK